MKRAIVLVAVGALALTFCLLWMNRYNYRHFGETTLRINRFTGQACYLQADGTWNSNRTAPEKWLEVYIQHEQGRPVEVSGKEVMVHGQMVPIEAVYEAAAKYAPNSCR